MDKEKIMLELEDLGISKENIKINEYMSKHTSFKIGGPADIFIKVTKIEKIKNIIKIATSNKIPFYVLGNGSNILVKDNGIRGIVIKIELKEININYNNEEALVTVGSGIQLGFLAHKLLKESIEGFEEFAGIPGTIGGAIRMNAGAHGKEMKDIIVETKYLDLNGNIKIINNEEHKFKYRDSLFGKEKYIILETTLRLKKGIKENIEKQMKEYAEYRKEKQPIEFPSAGSTFKRGEDFITAKLIDECGLKGYKIGGAEVSNKHAGFVINTGNATAEDVIKLTEYVKQKVYEKFKKKINLEIEIIGEE